MVIPWIVGGAAVALGVRWIWLRVKRRHNDRMFGAAIQNRQDVKRYLGD